MIFQQILLQHINPKAKDYKSLTPEEKEQYKNFVVFLKVALTGDPNSVLPIWEVMRVLGKDETMERLNCLIDKMK